jgi:hypothetical protein
MGCSEEFTPTPYTYSKIFTGKNNKTWQITLFEETLDGNVISKFMPSCLADDKFVFYANPEHSYQTMSGSRKCFEDEADVTSDVWTFSNATATLTMILPILTDTTLPFIVREADDDDLEIEIFFDTSNTASYRIHLEAIDEE